MSVQIVSLGRPARAQAFANRFPTAVISFDGVPKIVATRDGANVVITEIGSSAYSNFRIYRASDHRATFSVSESSTTLPYTDSGLNTTLNYKYKASFVATGNNDGTAYVSESQTSRPAYTIGSKGI